MGNPDLKDNDNTADQRPDPQAAAQDPGPGASDRPGLDLGGAVTDKTAGTGLGLGEDAAEDALARRLPGRRSADQAVSERASTGPDDTK